MAVSPIKAKECSYKPTREFKFTHDSININNYSLSMGRKKEPSFGKEDGKKWRKTYCKKYCKHTPKSTAKSTTNVRRKALQKALQKTTAWEGAKG